MDKDSSSLSLLIIGLLMQLLGRTDFPIPILRLNVYFSTSESSSDLSLTDLTNDFCLYFLNDLSEVLSDRFETDPVM